MKAIDPHSLLTQKPRTIENCGVVVELFNLWKKLVKEKTDSGFNEFDSFIAGYFLGTNAMLREKYLKSKPKEKTEELRWMA